MTGLRVRMVKEVGNLTTMICAENLWGVEQASKASYAELAFLRLPWDGYGL